jgi:hypothetical protein
MAESDTVFALKTLISYFNFPTHQSHGVCKNVFHVRLLISRKFLYSLLARPIAHKQKLKYKNLWYRHDVNQQFKQYVQNKN